MRAVARSRRTRSRVGGLDPADLDDTRAGVDPARITARAGDHPGLEDQLEESIGLGARGAEVDQLHVHDPGDVELGVGAHPARHVDERKRELDANKRRKMAKTGK